ncbi:MAG: D-alanine--D-alanine ligase [Firmicutes bacterium]|nr:D-alanine--D-alanine ligase [Bacillota bacterium]
MTRKLRIGVIFGGRSSEHEVSLISASCVLGAIDKNKYDVVPIGITKSGQWLLGDNALTLLTQHAQKELEGQGDPLGDTLLENQQVVPVSLVPIPGKASLVAVSPQENAVKAQQVLDGLDVVFPVLHGTYGEDGAIQGLLELADVPYVGSGITGSAVAMDKAMAKAVLAAGGFPQLPYLVVLRSQWEQNPELVRQEIEDRIGYPCFVKPANLGSSVGISKVRGPEELDGALAEAATYDRKLVIEQDAGNVREVECSVLGNENPVASIPGEIVPSREFYDYIAKYHDKDSQLIIPARISEKTAKRVQELAVKAFRAIDCAGMARVDFFVDKDTEEVYINELNTIPGFTPISMYPKLWEASGLSYGELIDRLIQLAIERHRDKQRNATSFKPEQ